MTTVTKDDGGMTNAEMTLTGVTTRTTGAFPSATACRVVKGTNGQDANDNRRGGQKMRTPAPTSTAVSNCSQGGLGGIAGVSGLSMALWG